MAYGAFKDLPKRAASDKILCNKALNIANNPKYDGYQKGLASMVYKFFDKNTFALILQVVLPKAKSCKTKNQKRIIISQLLEISKNKNYIHLL